MTLQFDFLRRLFDVAPVAPAPPGVVFVRSVKAKRYLLRVLPDGTARVTIPRRGSQREAQAFATRNQSWIDRQREKLRTRPMSKTTWQAGDIVVFRGEPLPLVVSDGSVSLGEVRLAVADAGADLRPALERRLRQMAMEELPERTFALANVHGFVVKRVTVRAQRSRWGSCSTRGTISLNWRLIQTPDFVRDYIILHELAHLRHMNHSARFWAEVERLCPEWKSAEAWLKKSGVPLR